MKTALIILIILIAQSAYCGQLVDLGGFEEGDSDGDGISDYWYPEPNPDPFELSAFCSEGSWSEEISLYSERGYSFGEFYESHRGALFARKVYNLQNNIAYDFVFDINPLGDDIDDISNYYYKVGVELGWYDSQGVHRHDNFWYGVGGDLLLNQWNRVVITKTFEDVVSADIRIRSTFYRDDEPPPDPGEWMSEWSWTTHLYIDTPVIPEPSMVLMILGILFVSRKARRVR